MRRGAGRREKERNSGEGGQQSESEKRGSTREGEKERRRMGRRGGRRKREGDETFVSISHIISHPFCVTQTILVPFPPLSNAMQ
jgi:hypothetical protein